MSTWKGRKSLFFKDYPKLKAGISTFNFLKSIPLDLNGLSEIIEYASETGFQYVEVRDFKADLTIDQCKELALVAERNQIDLIYVFNINPLDSGFSEVFERALANVMVLPGPGILRALVSRTEFDADKLKKGWNSEELVRLVDIAEHSAQIARERNIRFVVENNNESFFGDGLTYFGFADFFEKSNYTGLQMDIANPFCNSSRVKNDPEKVFSFLAGMNDRWVETHLKTVKNGEPQPVLTDNPLKIEKIVELMGRMNVIYVTLELVSTESKEECFNNHALSIQFLKDKGVLGN
jgi:sugar phosphate isomerase/epimerase